MMSGAGEVVTPNSFGAHAAGRHRCEVRFRPGQDRPFGRFAVGCPLRTLWPVTRTHRIAARTEGRLTNVGLGLLLAGVLGADTAVVAARPGGGSWPFELAIGLIVGVLTLLRGRAPVLAVTAGLTVCLAAEVAADVARLPSQPGVAATLGLLVLGAAAVRAAARRAALVAVAGAAVLVAGRVSVRHEYILPLAFLGLLAWGGALGVGVWLRFVDVRHQLAVDAARHDERLELARELHDVVAHHVAGIVVQAQAARLVAARRPETLEPTLAGIESAGTDALGAMRRVVGLLRDVGDPGDAAGVTHGPEELADLVSRFADQGPPVGLRLPDDGQASWPPEVASTVYRVVQEALTNVVLHAPEAAEVTVIVENGPSTVTVEVIDDGRAAPAAPSWFARRGGYGLVGMRERVEALGGRLQAGPGPAGGWAVRAEVPLPARSAR
jgi:signal transduction histidine kinase